MKKKLLVSLVALLCVSMIGSAFFVGLSVASQKSALVSRPPVSMDMMAADKTFNTSTPSWLYDFTNHSVESSFANMSSMEYAYKDGEYITFTATANDPYTWVQTPTFTAGEAKVVRIGYRTTVELDGEFFCCRSDNANMGAPGTNFSVKWNATGNWEETVYPCKAWDTAPEKTTFTVFRFDPLQGNPVQAGQAIDVKYIAFFPNNEEANKFNFDEYKAKLAYEEEQKKEEEEANKHTNWPDPTFKDMVTSEEDNAASSLVYKPSEDGKTVTISYKVNGEEVSYIVPNNQNYLTGGFAGVDDLNRPLYTSEEVGAYGTTGEHYVGLFYFMWHGEHGDSGIYDLQKIIDEKGEAAKDAASGNYGPVGAMHWFAEPLYGYYYGNDAWVQRKHAELLCNANIDFLYFDTTNGFPYLNNARQLMGILHELNEQGYDAPQVVFYTNSNAGNTARQIYNEIYKKGLYEDTWFCIDGKPVLVGPPEANIDNFFTLKANQWPNESQRHVDGWPWMDFQWPQRVFKDKDGKDSAISVSIAQHSGTIQFSDSALYGETRNRGRSFAAKRASAGSLRDQYAGWQKDPSLTLQGRNFQAQWDRAFEEDVPFVLVTGWNEWVAQRQGSKDPHQVRFVDTASMEFSRDSEMMRGGYFDNYYMQLIYNVQKLKGAAPVIVQDGRKPINVTGNFDQWNDIAVKYLDPKGDTVDRDATGFGHTHYENKTGRNDIVGSKVTSDSKNLYFYVETVNDVTMFDTESSWMQLFVNTDSKQETGWYGYDYIINYQAKDAFTTTVAKYDGTDGAFHFSPVGEVSYRAKGNQMMIAVPQELLGIDGYKEINLQFKWADASTKITSMEQFYTDGDAAPLGRLNNVYQNYIPGKSEVTYPETETTAPETDTTAPETTTGETTAADTTVVTPETTAPAVESTTEAPKKKGCQSVIGFTAVLPATAMAAAVLMYRRKRESRK